MTILDTIVEHKRMEVLKRKARTPLQLLQEKPNYKRTPLDPLDCFSSGKPGIIAEFKRKSPSKGLISEALNPAPVVKAYRDGGAVAASILTDRDFFGGSFKDLENVRDNVADFPLLRKDFIIDSYQLHEAKAYGADIILLIASVLSKYEISELSKVAASLGLTILLEVHSDDEVEKWNDNIGILGVNNRNLNTFSVDIKNSIDLFRVLPSEALKISESGLHRPADLKTLFNLGYKGFLMGEHFMKESDPGLALKRFINELNDD